MPSPDLINTIEIALAAGDKWRMTVSPITFPAGRTTADFASFTATIREDPEYPLLQDRKSVV